MFLKTLLNRTSKLQRIIQQYIIPAKPINDAIITTSNIFRKINYQKPHRLPRNLFINVTFLYQQVYFKWVKETNKTTNLQPHFFYNVVLYCLRDLLIALVYLYWKVFSFLEYFPQTNVLLEYAPFMLHL